MISNLFHKEDKKEVQRDANFKISHSSEILVSAIEHLV